MREITLFSCDVKIMKIDWPHQTNPVIRDRIGNKCTGKCIFIMNYFFLGYTYFIYIYLGLYNIRPLISSPGLDPIDTLGNV
jgi:hypothetical protein